MESEILQISIPNISLKITHQGGILTSGAMGGLASGGDGILLHWATCYSLALSTPCWSPLQLFATTCQVCLQFELLTHTPPDGKYNFILVEQDAMLDFTLFDGD